jgi:hypothetical protein
LFSLLCWVVINRLSTRGNKDYLSDENLLISFLHTMLENLLRKVDRRVISTTHRGNPEMNFRGTILNHSSRKPAYVGDRVHQSPSPKSPARKAAVG